VETGWITANSIVRLEEMKSLEKWSKE